MAIHAIPTKNALQSTLSSTLSLAETTSFAIADDWSSYLADVSATRLIILCVDRVDANGTKTPTKREYISATTATGGSGTTFATLVRGLGGSTQQAHTAGAVVEVVVDVNTIKSITDGFLVEHNTDGTHNLSGTVVIDGTSSTPAEVRLAEDTDNGTNYMGIKAPSAVTASVTLTLPDGAGSANQILSTDGSGTLSWATSTSLTKASGAEVTTGTDDAKYATPKALADAGVNTRLKSVVGSFTRDLSAVGAPTNVAYTGVGFVPTSIHFIGALPNSQVRSEGWSDSAKGGRGLYTTSTTANGSINTDFTAQGILGFQVSAGNRQFCLMTSYDADGFTLTWYKDGSPTGTANIHYIAYR